MSVLQIHLPVNVSILIDISYNYKVTIAVHCDLIHAPINGTVRFDLGIVYSSTATFSCNEGHTLIGSKIRICQSNGKWSGTQPVCSNNRHYVTHHKKY